MTALAFILGLVVVGAIYIGTLYLLAKKNEQENKINSQEVMINEQKIHEYVADETVDMLNADIASRDPSLKPKT